MKSLFRTTLQVTVAMLALFLGTAVHAQQTVTGKVVDAGGQPIVGATVLVAGTTNGVITAGDGTFSLRAQAGTPVVVSILGYQDVRTTLQEGMVVTMQDDAEMLEEVVVVGFGTQRKATLTGSVASVSGEILESRPVSNTTIGLQGQIPGLTITRTAARPGNEGLAIQLRGASSINSVEPLIIIDGSPAISTTEFSSLNPSDIESISVLKDASAAIYGSRAAGGVILVTTKKGKRGESLKVTYNGMVTVNTPANMIPLAGMGTWATKLVEASYQDYVQSDGKGGEVWTQRFLPQWKDVITANGKDIHPNFSDASATKENYTLADRMAEGVGFEFTDSKGILHYYDSNNWLDLLYGPTLSTQHNASVQGSTDRARYMASIGYANDRSIIKATYDGIKKYNTRVNLDFDLTKWLTWSNNLSYATSFVDSPRDGLDGLNSGMYDTPSAPAYTPEGYFYDFYVIGRSPLAAMLGAGRTKTEFETFRYGTTLTAKVTKDLKLTGSASLTRNNNLNTETKLTYEAAHWKSSQGIVVVNPGTSQYVQERIQRTFYQNYVLQADYTHSFLNAHNISAMIGINAEKNVYKNVTAKRTNLLYEGLYDLNTASSESANQTIAGGSHASGYFSYIARFNYDYKGRYLFEALGRRDGTSKFHPDYRWANFYAVSAGWRISEEKFIKENLAWLDNLKVRVSFGKTGGAISSLGNYDYLATMNTNGTYFFEGGKTGTAVLGAMTDYSRTWEVLQNFNAGVDFSFLQNRLTGSFDWYQKRNDNMLTQITYPAVLGATAPATNSAKMRVRGWEAQLGWQDRKGDFSYWVNATLADNRSLVTDFSGTDIWAAGRVAVRKGYPLNSLFVYKTDGYFSSYEEIEAYYKQYANATSALGGVAQTSANTHLRPGDIKKVLILDPANDKTEGKGNTGGAGDVYFYGDTNPHYTFGLNIGFQWKGFDFSTFIQGVGSLYLIRGGWGDNSGMNMCAFYRNYNNILTTHLDTWTWDNQNAEYPRLSLQNNKNNWNMNNNDSSIQNGWYSRVKNLTVGYTLPKKWMDRLAINRLRVYFSGDNIAELTGISDGYDPEKSTASRTSLPFARNWTFGIDLTF
jgi:TonB-linked SusC/RagA family outer membrane protein